MKASLFVVGTGIKAAGQITLEARATISSANRFFYLVADPVAEQYVRSLNITAETLADHYQQGKERYQTYLEMVETVLNALRKGEDVCVAFYGHPGVFVFPSRLMIRRAREEGYYAKMLPGISTADCLFADLGVDPGVPGCQSFEATAFLQNRWRFDTRCSLILWQVDIIGVTKHQRSSVDLDGIRLLKDYLAEEYGPEHTIILYETAIYPIFEPTVTSIRVRDLCNARAESTMTIYVPPLEPPNGG